MHLRTEEEHKEWTKEDWVRVIWSDESKISIFGSDGINYVRRRSGEDLLPECTLVTMKHPISVMVWGCMTRDAVVHIHIVDGILNAKKYQENILEAKLLPSIDDLFEGKTETCVFQQDSATCHTAKTVKNWFKAKKINDLKWPGNSPDLNLIENLWSRLKKLVRKEKPGNKRKLIEAIIKSRFHVISTEDLGNLVNSMPSRIAAVIKNNEYPTKY